MKGKNFKPKLFTPKSSKWQELANFIARKSRQFSIIKDLKKDPQLKKIHLQRDKIYSKIFIKNAR